MILLYEGLIGVRSTMVTEELNGTFINMSVLATVHAIAATTTTESLVLLRLSKFS